MNMDDLIVKYLLGSADADETMRIERWLAADERNMGRLRQFKTLWDLSGRTAVAARPDTQEALGRLRRRLGRMGRLRWEPERVMLRKGMAAAVLVGLLCVGIGIFVEMRRSGDRGAAGVGETARKGVAARAGGGGMAIVGVTVTVPGKDTLPDGSVVTLAAHSKFVYTPGLAGNSRTICLEGDADFSVSRDPTRPFVVLAGDIAVRVLGTSFLVRSGPDSTEVIVKTGVVQVSRDKDSMIVRAGERLTAFGKKAGMVLRDGTPKSGLVVKRASKESDPRRVMRSIINDLVKMKIVPDKDSVEWFALDPQHFIVNGRVMPVGMRQVFVAKYIKADGMGYYFEAEKGGKVSGMGYFFDRKDLY